MVADFFGTSSLPQDRVGFFSSRVGQHSQVLACRVQAGRPHACPPNCEFGSVRRRARHSAPGRQGGRLSPRRAVCTVLADLRGGRRSRYRHDNHHGAASSDHEGTALLLRVLWAVALLPAAGLSRAGELRIAELFWAALSLPVSRRWHNGAAEAAVSCAGRQSVPRDRAMSGTSPRHLLDNLGRGSSVNRKGVTF